jgi:hypothetical protein
LRKGFHETPKLLFCEVTSSFLVFLCTYSEVVYELDTIVIEMVPLKTKNTCRSDIYLRNTDDPWKPPFFCSIHSFSYVVSRLFCPVHVPIPETEFRIKQTQHTCIKWVLKFVWSTGSLCSSFVGRCQSSFRFGKLSIRA